MLDAEAETLETAARVLRKAPPSVGLGDDGTLSIEWDSAGFTLHIMLGWGEDELEAYLRDDATGVEREWPTKRPA